MTAQTDWRLQGNTVTGDSRLGTNSAYDVIIETNNVERMRFKSGGNIGVGTDNPLAKLDLVGDFRLGGILKFPLWTDLNAEPFRYAYINQDGQLRAGSSSQFLALAHRADCFVKDGENYPAPSWASLSGPDFGVLYTGETCPARVGIGTQYPKAALHVTSNAYMNRLYLGNIDAINDDFRLSIWDSPGGMNSPHSLFDVRDDGEVKLSFWGAASASPFSIWNGNTSDWYTRIYSDGAMDLNYYGTGGGVLNVFNKSLNESIAVLTSDGKWWCQGVIVKEVPFWPDYVFEDTYSLKPLSEVESFIEVNNHLPDMPSAEEVSQNGIAVEEMIRLLTLKVEELTLHAIAQEKQIVDLKAQIGAETEKK